jgi:CO dehydrogenase maturation factor
VLLVVSDPTIRGIQTAKRIDGLVDELALEIEKRVLIINRVSGSEGDELKSLAENSGLSVAGIVPQDDLIFEHDLRGRPIFQLPDDSKAVKAVFSILDSLRIP